MPPVRRPTSPTKRSGASGGTGTPPRGTPQTARPSGDATRPAGRGRPVATANGPVAHEQLVAPPLFSVRALALSVVLMLAFVLVYPTLHSYLSQRAQLAAAQQELAAAQAHQAELENDLQRWDDSAYVISQARSRLSFVMPGERGYRVVDPESIVEPTAADNGPAGTLTAGSSRPWYTDVWNSVTIAGTATSTN